MTKKLFSTVAAAAVLSTSLMAFDNIDGVSTTSTSIPYTFKTGNSTDLIKDVNSTSATSIINIVGSGQQGDALIFPAFNVGNGWESTVRVINTSTTNAVVAKVVLFAGDDSRELRDFNIYLSANDVWEGTIKIDTDGVAKLISTDESSPLQSIGTGMASVNTPMVTSAIGASSGYIEVIGCAMAVDLAHANGTIINTPTTVKTATAHKDHINLRADYVATAASARNILTPTVYTNGVITSGANVPAVDANTSLRTSITTLQYTFGDVTNVLTGDIRITDTINGKDMVMSAIKLSNVTADKTLGQTATAIMFTEGEAANIADRNLVAANNGLNNLSVIGTLVANFAEYNYGMLKLDADEFTVKNVYATYGDSSSAVNNMVLLTSPYKRLLVNSDVVLTTGASNKTNFGATSTVIGAMYKGVTASATAVTNYGYFDALALIFDQAETQASASQFSPANTPTMKFAYEVSASEGNTVSTDNLSTYLAQAGFAKGFVNLQFRNPAGVSTIPTQMIATTAAGRVVTNWITPEWK